MITVLTATYGDTPDPAKPPRRKGVRWVCVTDREAVPGWETTPALVEHPDPRLVAKHPKFHPFSYADTSLAVWVDAAGSLIRSGLEAAARNAVSGAVCAQFSHPERDCTYEEASALATLGWPDALPQVDTYRHAGHPEHWGLWATGLIVWADRSETRAFGEAWFHENATHTTRDQLSQAPLCREAGFVPATIPGDLWANDWVTWAPR